MPLHHFLLLHYSDILCLINSKNKVVNNYRYSVLISFSCINLHCLRFYNKFAVLLFIYVLLKFCIIKAKSTLFAIFILLTGYLAAQSSVEIKDILVSPVMEIDTVTNLPVESDMEKLAVLCKINDIAEAQTVQVLVGTTEDSGNILSVTANIVNEEGVFYLNYNGENIEITDNVINMYIELSEAQVETYNYITLFVIDGSNQESMHLVFTK